MADSNIGSLPAAESLNDDSLLVAEQQGQAVKVPGSMFKGFARESVSTYVNSAAEFAAAAEQSAADAASSLAQIGDSVYQAAGAAAAAQTAQMGAETARSEAEAAQAAAEAAASQIVLDKAAVEAAKIAAEAAQADAENAATQAALNKAAAEAAKTAAEVAQNAAETAKTDAESSSTAASEKATEAATSAETAKQYSGKPPIIQSGTWWTWDAEAQQYSDTGKRAVLGYDKTYESYEEMVADVANQEAMTTAIISSSVDDPYNAQLFIHDGTQWQYLADLSGFTGVGVESFALTSGNHAPGTTDIYTITLTDGKTTQIPVYNGLNGEGSGDVQGISFVVTLPVSGWTDGAQSISDTRFIAADRYSYIVGPVTASREDYQESGINVDDISTNGVLTFHNEADPEGDLTVKVLRLELPEDSTTSLGYAKVFGTGGAGGGGTGGLKLESIEITTPPTKTTYKSGELFDPTGMVVQANYSYGITAEITGYTYSPSVLTDDVTSVIISYAEGRTVKTVSQPVTVIPVLASIAVTTPPTKTAYSYMETFNSAGMAVTATYTDGSTSPVTGYTVPAVVFSQLGAQTVPVTYTEDGITKETSIPVIVSAIPVAVPAQSGVLTYNGSAQSPVWTGYDSNKMTIGGVTSAANAGTYSAAFALVYGYQWSDGTDAAKTVTWSIGKATPDLTATPSSVNLSVEQSTAEVTIAYTGDGTLSAVSGDNDIATASLDETALTVTGVGTGTTSVTVSASEGNNYLAASITVNVSMQSTQYITAVPAQNGTLTYNGSVQSPVWSNYSADQLDISGDASATDAGTYTAVFTPKAGYAWSDGSESKSVTWTIGRASITATPSQSGTLTYTGSAQTPTWLDYNSAQLTIGGTTSGTNAGSYTATFMPTANYQWSDGTTTSKSVTWSIAKAAGSLSVSPTSLSLTADSLTGAITVTRAGDGAISAVSDDTDVATVSVSGNIVTVSAATNASGALSGKSEGDIVQLKENGVLVDFYVAKHDYESGLNGAGRTLLVRKDCYDTRVWHRTDVNAYATSAINTWFNGTYKNLLDASIRTAMGTTKFYYTPGNGNTTVTTLERSVFALSCTELGQSGTYINIEGTALPSTVVNLLKTAYLNGSAVYQWTRSPRKNEVITAYVLIPSGGGATTSICTGTHGSRPAFTLPSNCIINADGTVSTESSTGGTANITISVSEGTNHTAPASKTVPVTVDLTSIPALIDATPEIIQQVAQEGTGANYWAVGDKIGIPLSGTVGALTLSDTYYAFIIGFDHNSTIEGTGIHFQFGKTAAGVDIAFVKSYGSTGTGFRMNTSNTNSGGWNNSYMRKTICPEFLAALPTAWRNIIAACTKYSDNTGGKSDTASYVTSTSDKIWLLSEYEVQGARTYANSAEQNYQQQYTYYANGNSKVKNKHNATATTCEWWLRSLDASSNAYFCCVYNDGGANGAISYYSYGFSPGFKVG